MDKKELEEFKLQEDFSKQIGDYNNNEIVNLQICRPLVELYKNPDKRIKGNTPSGDFWEILNAHINLNPFQPFLNIFRDFKKDYLEKEHKWYLSQSLSVNGYMDGIKIWDFCSSKDGKKMINSNYGNLVFSDENGNQFDYCLNRLKYNKETREAMIIFTRPSIQWECEEHGKHDFICTCYYHFFIRENKLEMILAQRSCDALPVTHPLAIIALRFQLRPSLVFLHRRSNNFATLLGVTLLAFVVSLETSGLIHHQHLMLFTEFRLCDFQHRKQLAGRLVHPLHVVVQHKAFIAWRQ